LLAATRTPCALVTVAATTGSVPRAADSDAAYADGKVSGTIGGGRFEALVVEMRLRRCAPKPLLKAMCTVNRVIRCDLRSEAVLIEPQTLVKRLPDRSGHCAQAIAAQWRPVLLA
jgi:xanthine/CO dehydrogenase XdhC/CoxF family maturation factor